MVDVEFDQGLAVPTIDRPHARNAISLDTMDQPENALHAAEGASAVVIAGAGDRAFVSGGDLKELSAIRTEEDAAAMVWRMRSICDRLANFPAPVIAALNGPALGGGAEVAVAANIRLAPDDIKIRVQSGSAKDHAGLGWRRAVSRTGRQEQGIAISWNRRRLDAAHAERIGLDQVLVHLRRGLAASGPSSLGPPRRRDQACHRRVSARSRECVCAAGVRDAHWEAADRVMNRSGKVGGAT